MDIKELKQSLLDILCPSGVWRLSQRMESLLEQQLKRLPRGSVSEEESRYPTTRQGMRALLDVFFARHYFQAQNSLVEHLISDEFMGLLLGGQLRVFDIGCGPAVVSLAITDLFDLLVKILRKAGQLSSPRKLELTYILNDTSPICLGMAKEMLVQHFSLWQYSPISVVPKIVLRIQKGFPENLWQLRRITQNYGPFEVASLSYVITPLTEQKGVNGLADAVSLLGSLCASNGSIMILQDKFKGETVRRLGRMLGASVRLKQYLQQVYSSRNPSETFPYAYYELVYKPFSGMGTKTKASFDDLPDHAIAFSKVTAAA